MPHNIGEMFYVGDKPWHDEGEKLDQLATLEEAISAAKLDWLVDLIPIQTAESLPTKITRRKAVVRTDRPAGSSGRVLGVVHPDFRPLQNREGLEQFDALVGHGKSVYQTGGYLGNGEVIWLMARFPENITVQGDDVVEPYLLFSNSHDGTRAIDIRLTTVRVVCQNTLNLALSKKNSQHIFKRSHNGNYGSLKSEANHYFEFVRTEIRNTQKEFNYLAEKECIPQVFQEYIEKLLPLPTEPQSVPTPSKAVENSYQSRKIAVIDMREKISNVFALGQKNEIEIPPADLNFWGAVNAVTAYVDHIQIFPGDTYASIMFGKGDQLKRNAYSLAMEMSKTGERN